MNDTHTPASEPASGPGGDSPARTGAGHYHTAEHHLACALAAYAKQDKTEDKTMGGWPQSPVRRHVRFAEVNAQLAIARTLGQLLVLVDGGRNEACRVEVAAWMAELDGNPPPAR